MANQLESRLSYLSLDALRNLVNQAFLLDRSDLARSAIFGVGYIQLISTIINNCMNLLKAQGTSKATRELCKLTLEQAFCNMEDLVNFLEGDSDDLKQMTGSA
mmetsp:Transcript_24381/g.37781  ORF Transcript_24381/g.37781 Transcript_24381/m.37781 type:complete len:103 (+) Transcript_24381:333-641(+)